jgi:hypothetical protein
MWDYEGKLECKQMHFREAMFVLLHRIMSPPGKLVRAVAFYFYLLEQSLDPDVLSSPVVTIQAGRSEDIPFSPLELTAEVRAEAACPDDADVELATWSYPGETVAEVYARTVLRRVAVRWWSWYQEADASNWLKTAPKDPWNVEAIASCVWRIKACKYFKWVRGSRIFFWKVPNDDLHKGWSEEFRDGIKLWELPGCTLPQGRMPNIKTDTREDELLTREKILRLRMCGYLESGEVKLVVPRFTVPKAGNDVRVVWDSKANGHNACLWAPSFLLGDSGDLEEMVFKWLSKPVGSYLLEGSPDEDYTQDASTLMLDNSLTIFRRIKMTNHILGLE